MHAYTYFVHGYPTDVTEEMLEETQQRLLLELEIQMNPTKVIGLANLEYKFYLFTPNGKPSPKRESHWIFEELHEKYPDTAHDKFVFADFESKDLFEYYSKLESVNERRIFFEFVKKFPSNTAWYKRLFGVMLAQTEDIELADSARFVLFGNFNDDLLDVEVYRMVLASAI